MGVDFKRLIPEYLLLSERLAQFIEALEQWFNEVNYDKVADLLEAYSPRTSIDDFLDLDTDLVGWTSVSDIVTKDRRGPLLVRSYEAWAVAGSRRFWDLVMYTLSSKLYYKDNSVSVMRWSVSSQWDHHRWEDADYWRDGVFLVDLTLQDMSAFEYVKQFFPAGLYLYYTLQWGAFGGSAFVLEANSSTPNVLWKFHENLSKSFRHGEKSAVHFYSKEASKEFPSSERFTGTTQDSSLRKELVHSTKEQFIAKWSSHSLSIPTTNWIASSYAEAGTRAIGDIQWRRPSITEREDTLPLT